LGVLYFAFFSLYEAGQLQRRNSLVNILSLGKKSNLLTGSTTATDSTSEVRAEVTGSDFLFLVCGGTSVVCVSGLALGAVFYI
jgi:hypothetical protein